MIQIDHQGPVAILTLDRPERHNALVPELLDALLAAIEQVGRESPAAIVLAANGASFSTGGDVRALHENRQNLGDYAHRLVGQLNACMLALIQQPAPVVCAVHGMVCGGSLGLLLAADVVLVNPAASITPYYGVVGFSPDGGWTALLPDRIGRQRAARVLLENASISAQQAVEWGLASECIDGDVKDAAVALATTMSNMVPGSNASARRLLSLDLNRVRAGLDAERDAFVDQIRSEQALLGMKRFLNIP